MKRNTDKLGRIVIPREMRNELDIQNGQEVNIDIEDNKIIITKPNGVKSAKEIKEKIGRLKEMQTDSVVNLLLDGFIAGLEWVLNEKSKLD